MTTDHGRPGPPTFRVALTADVGPTGLENFHFRSDRPLGHAQFATILTTLAEVAELWVGQVGARGPAVEALAELAGEPPLTPETAEARAVDLVRSGYWAEHCRELGAEVMRLRAEVQSLRAAPHESRS